jgi:hypothetical protein
MVVLLLILFGLVGCQLVADIHPRDFAPLEIEDAGDVGDGGMSSPCDAGTVPSDCSHR